MEAGQRRASKADQPSLEQAGNRSSQTWGNQEKPAQLTATNPASLLVLLGDGD